MTKKEILMEWINKPLSNSTIITPNNYLTYLGDCDLCLKHIVEFVLRKELLEKYLEDPSDETIENFFEEKRSNYKEYGYSGVEQRVFNIVARMFNCLDDLLY